jgi:ribonuclease P protein component
MRTAPPFAPGGALLDPVRCRRSRWHRRGRRIEDPSDRSRGLRCSERYTAPTVRAGAVSTSRERQRERRMWPNALLPVTRHPADRDEDVRSAGPGRMWMDEADVPTERAQASKDTRVPQTDVDEVRSSGDQGSTGEGPSATGRLTRGSANRAPRSIRSRRTFDQLRRSGRRGRSGPLTVSYRPEPAWDRPEVGYAIGRRVGNAVVRNRLRRRLRAIVNEQAPTLPVGAYMVVSGPGGPGLRYDEPKVAMSQAMDRATRERTARGSQQAGVR